MTVVSAVAVLFPGVGSTADELTVAVFEMRPPEEGAVTVIVIVGAAPTARLARVQVTVPEEWPQLHPDPLALLKLTPAGRTSVTRSADAVAGPALATSRV